MDKEQITFDGIPIPLTTETILNVLEKAYPNSVPFFGAFADDAKRERQYHAFRARILRIDAIGKSINADLITEIEMLNAWFAEQVDVNERLRLALNDCDVEITEKDTRIAELEKELEEEKEYWRELE